MFSILRLMQPRTGATIHAARRSAVFDGRHPRGQLVIALGREREQTRRRMRTMLMAAPSFAFCAIMPLAARRAVPQRLAAPATPSSAF